MAIGAERSAVASTDSETSKIYEAYEQFKKVIEELEKMEEAGLVKIIEKNEVTVGRMRYVDRIRFRRLQ